MFRHGVMQAYLIVASADADAIDAALASGADALVVHGEGPALATLSQAAKRPPLLVRIGPIESQDEQRLSTIVTARPEAILLDAAHGRDLAHLGARLAVHEAEQGLPDGAIASIALLARPEAFLHAASFVAASPRLRAIRGVARAARPGACAGAARRRRRWNRGDRDGLCWSGRGHVHGRNVGGTARWLCGHVGVGSGAGHANQYRSREEWHLSLASAFLRLGPGRPPCDTELSKFRYVLNRKQNSGQGKPLAVSSDCSCRILLNTFQ